ncbi:MAG: ferrous iron transporter B [Lachnospiraceae bacterium]|nr:ferrous iron transporter B [uncultured Acetatifactor sp.]MCI8788044.1 ferrous iron transporter B [Lachnospiraceae bacterium]
MAIKIALAGNPNCGKTTLFNALTGSNQFVGNWPGVTVEKKEGKLKKSYSAGSTEEIVIMDLPGIYSLSPYTLEEVVARNYLINERPDAIINIVDGTNIERNLYLSTQIMELGIPVVMAVNMMDVVEKSGDKIHTDKLAKKLGCEVTEISALKGTGLEAATKKAIAAAQKKTAAAPVHEFAQNVEAAIKAVEEKLGNGVPKEQKRFFAIKLLERDDKIGSMMSSAPDVSAEIKGLEDAFDDDTESIITNERYEYISSIIKECYTKKGKAKLSVSDKIDRIVTNRWAALPIFAVVMFIVYYISVTTVGTVATDWANDGVFGDGWHLLGIGGSAYDAACEEFAATTLFTDEVKATVEAAAQAGVIGAEDVLGAIEENDFGGFDEAYGSYADALAEAGYDLSEVVDPLLEEAPDPADYGVWVPGIPVLVEGGLEAVGCSEWLMSLILDGIIGGVGAVLGFVPQMLVLFIFLAFLEACGYMARVAFIMDRIFRKFGLSGKSFIPMLIGSGCGVPGIMASRTIENDRDRKMTIMTTTFIPCGAKLPIIALIATALFGGSGLVAVSAYFLGVAAIVISGIILKKTKMFAGDPAPFVMELPAYHWPTVGNVLRSMWERGWSFIKKAGTIILLSSIVIWAGSCFGMVDGSFGFSTELELADSVLGAIGNGIKWIFKPLGFDDATATIATIMGLVAKEEVVGVFGVLDFVSMTKAAAYAFLAFNLLCAPCFAAIGAIKREMNSAKWTWFAIGYQCGFAYVVALIIYQLGSLLGGYGNVLGTIVALLLIAALIYLLVRPYRESDRLKVDLKRLSKSKA